VSVSNRDRKLLLILVPIAVIVGFWFLLLSPKRQEASKAGEELTKQEKARDEARAKAAQLQSAKSTFATDYTALVRLGKAIPTSVDMPTLIVQLQSAAEGTNIRFDKIAEGAQQQSGTPAPAPSSGSGSNSSSSGSSSSGSTPNAAAGGKGAATGYGGATEAANNTAAKGNAGAAKTDQQGASPSDAQTSTSSKKGGLPVGGGAGGTSGAPGASASCAPGLECVPLDFEFSGSFFELADFFHSLKRFVRVVNDQVSVKGRLLTVDRFKFSTDQDTFPKLKAEVSATIYLSPKTQGSTAGASPKGPAPSGGGQSTPASGGSSPNSTPATTPTATAIK
jgi:type IV pilus assembly PilO-like protein